jgi:mRNA interferase HigB
MRIITKKRLQEFIAEYPDATASLKFWYDTIKSNSFFTVNEVTEMFNSSDFVGNNRIVFNIARNKYRLIAKFECHPRAQRVYIRFIGTHAQYDKIQDIANI